MSAHPSRYDLFGRTSLLNLERRLAEGKTSTVETRRRAEANSAGSLAGVVFGVLVEKACAAN